MKKSKFIFSIFTCASLLGLGACGGQGNQSMPADLSESAESTVPAHSHYWTLKSDTATCQKEGTKTYTCKCGETKTEISPKKDHDFIIGTGECKWCHKYKYDFTITNVLPCRAGYGYKMSSGQIHYYSKFEITELSFRTEYSKVQLYGVVKKTYDQSGDDGMHMISFRVKLASASGEILTVVNISEFDVVVGQKVDFEKDSSLVDYKLSTNEKYTATIEDYINN